jgi:hypothetical protein
MEAKENQVMTGIQSGPADGLAAGSADPIAALFKTVQRPLDSSPHAASVLAQARVNPRFGQGEADESV